MTDVLIPPWLTPASPETLRRIDDGTIIHTPAFARGGEQAGNVADPRWGFTRRYEGLRAEDRAILGTILNETIGRFNTLRTTPHRPRSGVWPGNELLPNNTFSSGVGSYTSSGPYFSVSVTDRVWRATLQTGNVLAGAPGISHPVVVTTPYIPYAARVFVSRHTSDDTYAIVFRNSSGTLIKSMALNVSSIGMIELMHCGSESGYRIDLRFGGAGNGISGDFIEIPYISLAPCALVDAGPNRCRFSDNFTNSNWVGSNLTAISSAGFAPDGNIACGLVENTSTAFHNIAQTVGVDSSTVDYMFACALKAGTRNAAYLQMGAANNVSCNVDLSTGSASGISIGSSWEAGRFATYNMGDGWFYVALLAKKISTLASITATIGASAAIGSSNYTGVNSAVAIQVWRATVAASPVPGRLSVTSSSPSSGTPPSGGSMYLKGLPSSMAGLLTSGEFVEWNAELKQLTSALHSNGVGLGRSFFRPAFAGSPNDCDIVHITEPFGRFRLSGEYETMTRWGRYDDCELTFAEAYL